MRRRRSSPCFACGCYPIGRGTDAATGWLCAACHPRLHKDAELVEATRTHLEARVFDGGAHIGPDEARVLFASLLELAMLDTPA